jgi:ABC-type sugar transport system ATPase subunit
MNAAIDTTLSDQRVLHVQERPAVVSARGLVRRYGEGDTAVEALRDVSLDVAAGGLTAVMGPSGSGKSTLMHILAGLDRPTEGTVEIAGENITRMGDNELTRLRRRHIGFVFQFFNLLPMLSAEENVVLPLSIAGEKPDKARLEQLLSDNLMGHVLIPKRTFDASFETPGDAYTLVRTSDPRALAGTLTAYPDARLLTVPKFAESRASDVKGVLNMLYVLLGLSVVVSLFGMVNTLALAVFERTREIGMLRAVGLTRRQTRRMVRREAIITALIGAALGIPLGLGLAAAATHALARYGVAFSLPLTSIVAFTVVAIVAGTLAAIVPARRAGRLNVLQALQYE